MEGIMDIDTLNPEIIKELNVAFNEAKLLGAELDTARRMVAITFS